MVQQILFGQRAPDVLGSCNNYGGRVEIDNEYSRKLCDDVLAPACASFGSFTALQIKADNVIGQALQSHDISLPPSPTVHCPGRNQTTSQQSDKQDVYWLARVLSW